MPRHAGCPVEGCGSCPKRSTRVTLPANPQFSLEVEPPDSMGYAGRHGCRAEVRLKRPRPVKGSYLPSRTGGQSPPMSVGAAALTSHTTMADLRHVRGPRSK